MQWVADLTCEHEAQPPWAELQQDDARQQLFASGRVSMLFGAFGLVPYFQQNASGFTWDVAPVPAKADQKQEGSLIVFCIPREARNPEAAWELLRFLGGPEGARIFAEGKYFIPANPEAGQLIQAGEQPPAHVSIFVEAANFQSAVNPSQYQEQAEQIYRPQLDLVYTCQSSAEEALGGVREQVEAALAGEG